MLFISFGYLGNISGVDLLGGLGRVLVAGVEFGLGVLYFGVIVGRSCVLF